MGHGFHSYLKLLVQGYCNISLWISLLLWYSHFETIHLPPCCITIMATPTRSTGSARRCAEILSADHWSCFIGKKKLRRFFSPLFLIFSKMRKFVSWFFRYRKVQMSKSGFRAHPLQVQFWLLFAVQWSHSQGRQRDSAGDANRLGRSWEKQPK